MKTLDNELTSSPVSYQISMRLTQIVAYYGFNVVEKMLTKDSTTHGIVRLDECKMHLNNLLLTYGPKKVMQIFNEIYSKVA